MKDKFRCTCPITSSLDILGDKWTLVIIKQMLIEHKKTFKDFIESEEAIATNILSARLKTMEEFELLNKTKLPMNKKTNVYLLTPRAIDLAGIIVDLGNWGNEYLSELNPELIPHPEAESAKNHRTQVIEYLKKNYEEKVVQGFTR